MLNVNDILDALEAEAETIFPGEKVYRNLVRQNFQRPSTMVELGRMTMEDATRRTVDRTAVVKLTLFEAVDDYHDTQVELLAHKLALAMAHFSRGAVPVGDRYLDVSQVSGEYFNDYAQLTFTLSWQDDRDIRPVEAAIAEYYVLAASAGATEEEIAHGNT